MDKGGKMDLKPFEIFNVSEPADVCMVPEGTILLAYRGSMAHGMYIKPEDPKSIDDTDLMGVVIGKLEHYFGLHEWGSRGTYEWKKGRWDCVYYEARKLVSLLLQGNPNVLSLLWCQPEHYLHRSELGWRLVKNRSLFVGKHVYNAFAGYAHCQLEKMETRDPVELREYLAITAELKRRGAHPNHKGEVFDIPEPSTGVERDVVAWSLDKLMAGLRHYQKKGENIGYMGEKRKQLVLEHGYDSKNAAHLIRLLRMCVEFMQEGELHVMRPDAAELLEVKRGEWPLVRIKQESEHLFAAAREARDRSTLPAEPDRERAEALLISIVRDALYWERWNGGQSKEA